MDPEKELQDSAALPVDQRGMFMKLDSGDAILFDVETLQIVDWYLGSLMEFRVDCM